MLNLNNAEKFTLCVLEIEEKEKSLFYSSKNCASVVISVFMELLNNEIIKINDKKKIIIENELDTKKEYLKLVYDKIADEKPKSLKGWVEYYIAGFSQKPVKELIESIISYLEENNTLKIEREKGILKESRLYKVNQNILQEIIQEIKDEFLMNDKVMLKMMNLTILLVQNNLENKYFSKDEQEALKAKMKEVKKSEVWEIAKISQQVIEEIESIVAAIASI